MKRIGAFCGKFYPPHIGHISAIEKALEKCDEVYIIISKNDKRNNELKKETNFFFEAEKIKGWFEKHFEGNPRIKVAIFDETNLRPYPLDTDIWAEKFKKQFPMINVKIADIGYKSFNDKFFPEYDFVEIDRDTLNIHSTMIRDNPKKYFKYIVPEAQKDLTYMLENNKNIEI